jgi:DNA-binding GntR family transcriptional regulator
LAAVQFRHSHERGKGGPNDRALILPQRRLALRPVENETLHARVYNQLHQALICGTFQPGQPVTLRQLMVNLGTSVMPVRSAIGRLIAEGALDMLPNRSVIVPRMSRAKLVELWQLRQMMEGMAAEQACQRAAAVLIPEIKTINAALKKAILDRDIGRMLTENYRFHFAIYERSGLTVLPPILHTLWLQAGPFLSLTFAADDRLWTTIRHTAAIRAFEAGDAPGVRAAIEQDIEDTLKPLLKRGLFSEQGGK